MQIDLDFELRTLDGEVFDARRLLGRPTILILLRYLGWLYCQEHLSQLREFDREIADLDGQVAVISFGRPDHLKRFAAHMGHPYSWLADPERRSYRSLGLGRKGLLSIAPPRVIWAHVRFAFRGKIWHPEQLDVAQMGGDFVFDRSGKLSLRHLSSASDDRPTIKVVMSALRRAASLSVDEGDR